ncbi:MAG: DNA replication/repair protein RecF [Chloroflexi bacterium]|nr:DNA replication/repair protein RecF [Chloroflexota bacterium]
MNLVNFRNYEALDLDLGPGTVLVQGDNGQGKSNLLESIYILAIAKSPWASSDRELVRRDTSQPVTYSRIAAVVRRTGDDLKLQIDLGNLGTEVPDLDGNPTIQKLIRVNGAPRRAIDFVGQLSAVMFSAQDLEVVFGPPAARRRYLDILISQFDRQYLGALQRYQRVLSQRNHLLKRLRDGSARTDELDVWNDQLVFEAKYVMARRVETVAGLSELSAVIHLELSGTGEQLGLQYRPSADLAAEGSEESLAEQLRGAMEARRAREIAQGMTVCGPHRDDVEIRIDGLEAAPYASRGQARTAILSLRLAEAQYLKYHRGQEPVLLLDDVLSELDAARRLQVIQRASQYEQCFISTSDPATVAGPLLAHATRLTIHGGAAVKVDSEQADPAGE